MNSIDVIVGGLLGDEGKGKLVGRIGKEYDAVLRVNASTNAGHCVSDGDNHYVTRQLPSVFFPSKTDLVIAPGALLNLEAFYEELASRPDLKELHGKVKVASSISLVIAPYLEKDREKVGSLLESTRQGTGPSAAARSMRHSLRLFDIEEASKNNEHYQAILQKLILTTEETLPFKYKNDRATLLAMSLSLLSHLVDTYNKIRALVGNFCVDYTSYAVENLLCPTKNLLIEGCNGLLLDNLHGMHPYVTSASTNIGAMLSGANFSHHAVRKVIVVVSSYATCLGKRPFPTEMEESDTAHFFNNCNEIDVAESKKRRIGWLDLPALRKALAGSSGAVLHMNKLDVLSGVKQLKVCTHYQVNGKKVDFMPDTPYIHANLKPHYEILEGWDVSIQNCRSFDELPQQAKDYIAFVSSQLSFPIESVGVGPDNQQYLRTL